MLSGTTVTPLSFSTICGAKDGCARDASNNPEDAVRVDRDTCGSNGSIPHVPLQVDEARAQKASKSRIEPIDSRLRLHFGRTKVCASLNPPLVASCLRIKFSVHVEAFCVHAGASPNQIPVCKIQQFKTFNLSGRSGR